MRDLGLEGICCLWAANAGEHPDVRGLLIPQDVPGEKVLGCLHRIASTVAHPIIALETVIDEIEKDDWRGMGYA